MRVSSHVRGWVGGFQYKPPNHAALTIRIYPATCMLYAGGKMVIIRARTHSEAIYYSNQFCQAISRVPLIMRSQKTGELVVRTLEGHLTCKRDGIQNIVGSGALPQDGVHLTKLLYSDEEKVTWDPGGFINLIYKVSAPRRDGFPLPVNCLEGRFTRTRTHTGQPARWNALLRQRGQHGQDCLDGPAHHPGHARRVQAHVSRAARV